MSKLRGKLTYANVIATLALFIAVGGASAFAASHLAKNSVGTKQLRKNAVTSAKVKDRSLLAQDFKTGQLPAGPQGLPGAKGAPGPAGAPGQAADGSRVTTLENEVSTLTSEVDTLEGTLAGVTRSANTLTLSGMNVQIDSGAGHTSTLGNGLGNLIMGYNENAGTQTGSNNLVVGDGQSFTSYGGLVTGEANTIAAPFASVTGGTENAATGTASAISGGEFDIAGDPFSAIGGGCDNITGAGTANTSTCNAGGEGITGGASIAGTVKDSTSGAISDGENYAGSGTIGLTSLPANTCVQFSVTGLSGLKVGDVVSLAYAATPPPGGLIIVPIGVKTAGQALVNACNDSASSVTWSSVVRILSFR